MGLRALSQRELPYSTHYFPYSTHITFHFPSNTHAILPLSLQGTRIAKPPPPAHMLHRLLRLTFPLQHTLFESTSLQRTSNYRKVCAEGRIVVQTFYAILRLSKNPSSTHITCNKITFSDNLLHVVVIVVHSNLAKAMSPTLKTSWRSE